MNRIKPYWKLAAVAGVLVLAAIVISTQFSSTEATDVEATTSDLPVVTLTSAATYSGGTSVSLIGTVRAFSEAAVTAERAGRVTSVPIRLGQEVGAGQVIATLENASEQAAVLQAEGVYEAALAGAAQNNVGTAEAENQLTSARKSAVTTYQSAYNTVNNIILTTVDPLFANPNNSVPGLRIDGKGQANSLNNERVAFQTILPAWQANTTAITPDVDVVTKLNEADDIVVRTRTLIDTFLTVFNAQDRSSRYSEEELQAFISEFSAARAQLVSTQTAIDAAQTQLIAAREGVQRATIAASGSDTSAADAQVKQALGGLRAAQANLAKTVIRTPISGTVNSLSVRTGDFVGAQQQVAEVANNNSLEIVTALGDTERELFTTGDAVTVAGNLTGTVTEIAPAVDSVTGKTEMRVALSSDSLQNGETVTIRTTASTSAPSQVMIPLSAVQFAEDDGVVFFVENDTLVAQPITLGAVRGGSVEVIIGLSSEDIFVKDARGLRAGAAVTVKQ